MKKSLISLALANALLLVTASAISATAGENYVGVQYAYGYYDEDNISETFSPTLLVGRFGRYLNPNFSIEARLGVGLQDDTRTLSEFGVSGVDATLELDSMLGIYATGHINLGRASSLYAVLGGSTVKATASLPDFPGVESREDNSSVSYGIGADIGIGSNAAVNIEYMQYLDKSEFDLGALAVGAVFRF